MKTIKLLAIAIIVGLIAGATLFGLYGPEKTIVETVESYVSNVPKDIEDILQENPDLAEAVRNEAEKRAIRAEITELEGIIDSKVQRLTELENEGFTGVDIQN